jgi:hypothetical protein
VKDFEKPALEKQAIASGRPLVELEREQRYPFAKPQVYATNFPQRGQQQPRPFQGQSKCTKSYEIEEKTQNLYVWG